MKFIRKIYILSDGSLFFDKEMQIPSDTLVSCLLEDEKNFFFKKKKKIRQFNLKSSLKYKKKYFN